MVRRLLGPGLLIATMLSASCQPREDVYHYRFLAFGTLNDVSIAGVPEPRAYQASEDLRVLFERLHREWRPWGDGELADLNRELVARGKGSASRELMTLVGRAFTLSRQSGQRFHPGVALLVRSWGFDRIGENLPAIPDPARLRELVSKLPDADLVDIDELTITSPNAGWAIDLGGIAKGTAVDIAIQHLRDRGIANAIVNAGGDLRAIGSAGDRPWRIGIRDPRGNGTIAWLETMGDECVFTSGDYQRFFDIDGHRYHHIIDPVTGMPASGTASVTVIAGEGTLADAAATALFVAGIDDWVGTASAMGIDQVMLIGVDGRIEMTAAMAMRITLTTDQTVVTIRELQDGRDEHGAVK